MDVYGGAFNMDGNAVIAGNSGFGVEVAVYTGDLNRVDGAFTMKGSASITGNTGGGVKVGTRDSSGHTTTFTVVQQCDDQGQHG